MHKKTKTSPAKLAQQRDRRAIKARRLSKAKPVRTARASKPVLHPIQKARTDAGWSRARLAKASHISASYVSLLENGNRVASEIVLSDISKALGVPVRDLMTAEQLRAVTRTIRAVTGRIVKARA